MSWHVVPRFSVAVALLLVLAALPASSALGRRSPLSSLEHVPTRGGWPLTDVVLGRSEAKDYRGSSYLYFAISPQKDVHVSGSMLRDGGVWEGGLNKLFSTLVAEAKVSPNDRNVAVLDVGANIGAFSLYVASLGYRLYSFEMQEMVYTLLELSRRVNNYAHMHTFHCALWNESGVEISFTPVIGNFGGTSMLHSGVGSVRMTSVRLDSLFTHSEVFFLKIDVENAEAMVLRGIDTLLSSGGVKHLVMETRSNQVDVILWLYDLGFECGSYSRRMWSRQDAQRKIASIGPSGYDDVYCRFQAVVVPPAQRALLSQKELQGIYTPGSGWR